MASNRKTFLAGVASGIGASIAVALMTGAGGQPAASGGRWLTASSDGRTVYLWDFSTGQINYVTSAHAPKGHNEGKEDENVNAGNTPAQPPKKDKDKEGPGRGRGGG